MNIYIYYNFWHCTEDRGG